MQITGQYARLLVLIGSVLSANIAHADPVSPPPVCTVKGAACHDLGKDGICVAAKCTQATPEGDVEYDCLACDTSAGGAAGAPGSAGATANGGSANGGSANGGAPSAGATANGGATSAGATNAGAANAGAAGTPSSAGAPSSAGTSNLAGDAGSAGVLRGAAQDAGCSCSLRSLGSEQSAAALLFGMGAVALGVSRRRRRPHR